MGGGGEKREKWAGQGKEVAREDIKWESGHCVVQQLETPQLDRKHNSVGTYLPDTSLLRNKPKQGLN